jgi:protein-S-isoprenylcysteine O-methyltransferase Ste14
MIFVAWLLIHLLAMLVMSLVVGHQPKISHDRESILMNALWYSIALLWFFDQREPEIELFALGFVVYANAAALLIWARYENPYFKPQVELPPVIIQSGPYRWLRHPGYIGMVGMGLGSALMLGHALGFIPLGVYASLLINRAIRENRLLQQ